MEYTQQTAVPEDQQAEALGETGARAGSSALAKVSQDANVTTTATKPGEGRELNNGLKYETVKEGTGAVATPGSRVSVHYTGSLTNGKVFDTSRKRNEPFTFQLGNGEVIKGWDLGVAGMKVGEVRKLVIPSELGYGVSGHPPAIPSNATLNFEVELVGVE
jgi:FKBP-type peptidyl-prolyl cis-trans isomerase